MRKTERSSKVCDDITQADNRGEDSSSHTHTPKSGDLDEREPSSGRGQSSPTPSSRIYPVSQDSSNHRSPLFVGGPGTILPFWLESLCCWILAISCLGVALYYWARQWILGSIRLPFASSSSSPFVPLMTHSRYELSNASGLERYQQLIQYLQKRYCQHKHPTKALEQWTDTDWILMFRSDDTARRLLSLVRLKFNDLPPSLQQDTLMECMIRIWPRLLTLPDDDDSPKGDSYPYSLSVIISAYKEDGIVLRSKLQHALEGAHKPQEIQWIVVDAGQCSHLDVVVSMLPTTATTLQLVKGHGGGRGPSLNQGAQHAQGRILVFLHADTRLATGWDVAIRNAFDCQPSRTTSAAAFSFSIDTTSHGLQGGPCPPGIKAIEATANWRTQLFSLPYGDQCISIPKVYFDYLGGYPHQCLMEDYELISLLRHRRMACQERLAILPLSAYCGPRRWQALGVLYVTYTNSRCVRSYVNGVLTPDQLYEIYYGCHGTESAMPKKSPWEVQLEQLLAQK
jgi:glycosyltransferase involved in cell wall biosynthesis